MFKLNFLPVICYKESSGGAQIEQVSICPQVCPMLIVTGRGTCVTDKPVSVKNRILLVKCYTSFERAASFVFVICYNFWSSIREYPETLT